MQTPVKIYLENEGHYVPRNPHKPQDLTDIRTRLAQIECELGDLSFQLRQPGELTDSMRHSATEILWHLFELYSLLGINIEPEWNNFTAAKLGETQPPVPNHP